MIDGVQQIIRRGAFLASLLLLAVAFSAAAENTPRGTHRGTHGTGIPGTSGTPDPRNHAESAQPGSTKWAVLGSNQWPQLVDSEQPSHRFAAVRPQRMVEPDLAAREHLSERNRTMNVAIVATSPSARADGARLRVCLS